MNGYIADVMNVYEKRKEIDKEADGELESKFSVDFNIRRLSKNYKIRFQKDYEIALKCFKYLFSLGGDYLIYLWNRCFVFFLSGKIGYGIDAIVIEDYSLKEQEFIKEVYHVFQHNSGNNDPFDPCSRNINGSFFSKRLRLEPYSDSTRTAYLSFFHNHKEEFEQYSGVEHQEDEIEKCYDPIKRYLLFAMVEKDTGTFVGSVGLDPIDLPEGKFNIEYFVFPEHRKMGYAKEALCMLIGLARKKKLNILYETIRDGLFKIGPADIRMIHAETRSDNEASKHLLKSLGFSFEETIPEKADIRGERFDYDCFYLFL